MIKVEGVSKSFGAINAVDNLSFEIKEGEIVGFLGPNGAGKTTTMRIITGFLSPDSGSVSIAGIPVGERVTEAQRHIGYLPENNPLYKDMLVSEILGLSADLKDIPHDKRKGAFDFAVSAVDIGDVFYRPIGELSKGFKQRVGIAIALINRPDVLIMDEPTEGLDPNQRTEIRSLVKTLAKGRTIIMSTHVMQEASAVCNRLLIINKGRLIADGTSDDLSRLAKHERIIYLEIEGDGAESALKEIAAKGSIEMNKADGRIRAKVITERSVELRPEISRYAHKNGWVIWRVQEEEHNLEDIFHKLTSSED